MPKTLDARHLSARKYETQRQNNFEIQISDLSEDIMFAVVSFPLPTRANNVIEVPYGNAPIKVAGTATFTGGDLVLRDFMEADIEAKIDAWQKQVYNPDDGSIGWAADYKRQATVYEYSPDGQFIRTWTLEGCWPSSVAYGNLDNTSGDLKQITITLEYDRAYRNS